MKKSKKGFSLIEIIAVVAIIALLSSVVIVGFSNIRANSRDAKRISDMESISGALELYYRAKGEYPKSPVPNKWDSSCTGTGSSTYAVNCVGENWIVGLAPNFMQVLPKDPRQSTNFDPNGFTYLYLSDGFDYKVMAWQMENENGMDRAVNDGGKDGSEDTNICTSSPVIVNRNTCPAADGPKLCNYEISTLGAKCW